MAQDRFYFWRGYWDALQRLPPTMRGDFVSAMCQYAFDGIEPAFESEMLEFAWQFVKDQISESVRIGQEQSARGKRGGRPKTTAKSTAKTTALSGGKSTVKSGAKSGVKSGAETTAESGAESVRYSNVPSASRTSAGADALALDESEQWYVENGFDVPFVPSESDA